MINTFRADRQAILDLLLELRTRAEDIAAIELPNASPSYRANLGRSILRRSIVEASVTLGHVDMTLDNINFEVWNRVPESSRATCRLSIVSEPVPYEDYDDCQFVATYDVLESDHAYLTRLLTLKQKLSTKKHSTEEKLQLRRSIERCIFTTSKSDLDGKTLVIQSCIDDLVALHEAETCYNDQHALYELEAKLLERYSK